MDKAYSTNDEEYKYSDPSDALQELADNDLLEIGREYYEMDCEPVPFTNYLSAARILDDAQEQIYDEIGEAADDVFAVNKEAEAELDALLAVWAAKHLRPGQYWKCVGKKRVLKVTAEDVAEYAT